jgi:hypothetical protein
MWKEPVEGGHWKLFAVLVAMMVAMADVPKFFHPAKEEPLFLFLSALDIAAALGLIAYATERPLLPRIVWRIVAPLFALSCIAQFSATGLVVGPLLQQQGRGALVGFLLMLVPAGMIGVFACIGLFRQADWLETPR